MAEWKGVGDLPGGGHTLTIDPPPELVETITLDVYERALMLLGMDPDAVLAGEADFEDVARPKLDQAYAFLSVVLTNADEYDLGSMTPGQADGFLAMVTAHFIMASLAS